MSRRVERTALKAHLNRSGGSETGEECTRQQADAHDGLPWAAARLLPACRVSGPARVVVHLFSSAMTQKSVLVGRKLEISTVFTTSADNMMLKRLVPAGV
jgi:hypothetical protein